MRENISNKAFGESSIHTCIVKWNLLFVVQSINFSREIVIFND